MNSFHAGTRVSLQELESVSFYYVAKHLDSRKQHGNDLFAFCPKRKWELKSIMPGCTMNNTVATEHYCVIAYLVIDNFIHFLTPSPSFQASYQPQHSPSKHPIDYNPSAASEAVAHISNESPSRKHARHVPDQEERDAISADDWLHVVDILEE